MVHRIGGAHLVRRVNHEVTIGIVPILPMSWGTRNDRVASEVARGYAVRNVVVDDEVMGDYVRNRSVHVAV